MQARVRLFSFWLLILLPTLLIGGMALVLLRHEQGRLETTVRDNLQARARNQAEDVRLAAANIRDGLLETLKGFEARELDASLDNLERSNPLVRNTFICDNFGRIQRPASDLALPTERRNFLERYRELFGQRIAWMIQPGEEGQAGPPPIDLAQVIAQPTMNQQLAIPEQQQQGQSKYEVIEQLRSTSRLGNKSDYDNSGKGQATPPVKSDLKSGWIPWYQGNQFYLLGYVYDARAAQCYGLELERVALLSRLTAALQYDAKAGGGFVFRDRHAQEVHRIGEVPEDPEVQPAVIEPIGPLLPHYEIAAYLGSQRVRLFGRGFLLLSSLLVGTFMAAILAGSALLLNQARRHQLEAQRKTSFVANVSHELKTPLTTIRLYTEMLNEGRVQGEEKRKRYLNTLQSESERLTRLVNNVLDFSRLEQGRKNYQATDLDLTELVTEVLAQQTPRLEAAGMQLHLPEASLPCPVRADRDALEQVLLNLIDNAIKYAAAGRELAVTCTCDPEQVQLRIQDRGPGVPDAQRRRIFDKFHRVDDRLCAAQGGSGLGLSIARGLVDGMGGRLWHENRNGGGSCFVVELPRNHPAGQI